MDVINFISWIKRGDYRETLPTDTANLLLVGAKDVTRDDDYRSLAVNAQSLLSVYDAGVVTQTGSITGAVTLNSYNGVITTVSATTAANSTEATGFVVNNSNVTSSSKILLSCQYSGANDSIPAALVSSVTNGSFTVKLGNGGSAALNAPVKIHFIILV
jgi:hypothetical protein